MDSSASSTHHTIKFCAILWHCKQNVSHAFTIIHMVTHDYPTETLGFTVTVELGLSKNGKETHVKNNYSVQYQTP